MLLIPLLPSSGFTTVRHLGLAGRTLDALVGHVVGTLQIVRTVPVHLLDVSLKATTGQLPGGAELQNLTNGIGGWALVLALVGLVVGAALWALGAHSQNYQHSFVGRRAVLVSGLAALLIGAAPALINFFFHAGLKVR